MNGKGRFSILKIIAVILAVLIVICAVGLYVISRHIGAYAKQAAIVYLHDEFHADVEIGDVQIYNFPRIRVEGKNLILRQAGAEGVPPLIEVREFSAETHAFDLFWPQRKIDRVNIVGLSIHIPPKQGNKPRFQLWGKRKFSILIRELTADDSELEIIPNSPTALPHVFAIHHVVMQSLDPTQPASYEAELHNAIPPGEIQAQGTFGPWNSDEPSDTPLTGKYNFSHADLGVFKGISGTLSSTGQFAGVLDRIDVHGQTDTPNFALKVCGRPVPLHTEFDATVDGTNGNTDLHKVRASFLRTVAIANGDIAKRQGDKTRTIVVNATVNRGRLEDMMQLAVKAEKPLMTGYVSLHARVALPPISEDMVERLKLTGQFDVEKGEFTNPEVNEKVETLSRKGLGKPGDEDAGSGVSALSGNFIMNEAVLDFHQLAFQVAGAEVQLEGTYGLEDQQLNFHGKLLLAAKLSQTMTGAKSLLLKPFDPFFRKNNTTELPIKVTGTKDKPSFGLDLHHKNDTASNQ